jgi:serine/threonine-protein kinase
LGAVFVALDEELNREVVLKQILDGHADDPVSRQRFVLEAEVTGGLEQPGIVPVYGLGTYGDGRPYYAMRFIRGDSLKEAIDRFHADPALKSDSGNRSLELRKLLRRFLDVCNAIDYAHSRGVFHRDIKPGNIIVGKHGETMVVDWGLAKPRGRADLAPSTEERPLVPSSASGTAETLPGTALGTPAYMSPEQARGDLENLGPRRNVFSLGATLYYLLTGRPPVENDDPGAVLRAVQRCDFPLPCSLDPSIDQALQAVCLKAMALQPGDRYGSPKDVSEDLERWMASEPVTAWREPWTRKLLRWLTRHRVGLTAAGAALLAGVVGLIAVLGVQAQANSLLRHANARVTRANDDLQSANQRERQRFNLAMEAIRFFHRQVSADLLMNEKQFERLRTKLFSGAADFYGKLGKQLEGQDDPASRTALGQAYDELGELTSQIGDKPKALDVHRKTLAVRRNLASPPGAGAEIGLDMAKSLIAVGRLHQETSDPSGALASFAEARSVLSGLVRPGADHDSIRGEIVRADYWMGLTYRHAGQRREALASYERARAIVADLVGAHREVVDHQRLLSWCDNDVGLLLMEEGRMKEALAAFERSRQTKERIADDHPEVTEYRRDLAIPYWNIASLLVETGKPVEALAAYEKARGILQHLVKANPAVSQLQYDLSCDHDNVGYTFGQMGRQAEALAAYEKPLAIRRRPAESNPTVAKYPRALGYSHGNIGWLSYTLGRRAEAEEAYEQAVPHFQRLVQASPDVASDRDYLANLWANIGLVRTDSGDTAGATAVIEKALEARKRLVRDHRSVTYYTAGLAQNLWALGRAHQRIGRTTEAAAALRRSVGLWASLKNLEIEERVLMACSRSVLASVAGQPASNITAAEGSAECEQAMADLRRAVTDGYRTVDFLHTNADLDPLRSRLDFQVLMMDLAFPADPFSSDTDTDR